MFEIFYKLIEGKFVRYPFIKLKVGDIVKHHGFKQRYKIKKIKVANEIITCDNIHSEILGGSYNEIKSEGKRWQ